MLAKRIIPCLDVTGGRVVKGVNFVELRDAGDPVEIAARYNEQGADELTFLDITATSDARDVILHIIEAVASQVFIPLTVGGGVRTVDDVRRLLNAGADKVSFNSAAIANPQVIRDASQKYGAQCIVVAIDAKRRNAEEEQRLNAQGQAMGPGWDVFSHGGRKRTSYCFPPWSCIRPNYHTNQTPRDINSSPATRSPRRRGLRVLNREPRCRGPGRILLLSCFPFRRPPTPLKKEDE